MLIKQGPNICPVCGSSEIPLKPFEHKGYFHHFRVCENCGWIFTVIFWGNLKTGEKGE